MYMHFCLLCRYKSFILGISHSKMIPTEEWYQYNVFILSKTAYNGQWKYTEACRINELYHKCVVMIFNNLPNTEEFRPFLLAGLLIIKEINKTLDYIIFPCVYFLLIFSVKKVYKILLVVSRVTDEFNHRVWIYR